MLYTIEEFDKVKTKVLKYVMYKKRTKSQVYTRFKTEIEEELLDDVIKDLEENGYINDESYVKKAVNEYMALKNLSIKEIKYKLYSNGISTNIIDNYITNNFEDLEDYEKKSAENIAIKRSVNMDELEIKQYLMKRGYKEENIQNAISKIEE